MKSSEWFEKELLAAPKNNKTVLVHTIVKLQESNQGKLETWQTKYTEKDIEKQLLHTI